jgi:hypothetical protein
MRAGCLGLGQTNSCRRRQKAPAVVHPWTTVLSPCWPIGCGVQRYGPRIRRSTDSIDRGQLERLQPSPFRASSTRTSLVDASSFQIVPRARAGVLPVSLDLAPGVGRGEVPEGIGRLRFAGQASYDQGRAPSGMTGPVWPARSSRAGVRLPACRSAQVRDHQKPPEGRRSFVR